MQEMTDKRCDSFRSLTILRRSSIRLNRQAVYAAHGVGRRIGTCLQVYPNDGTLADFGVYSLLLEEFPSTFDWLGNWMQ